MNNAPVHSTPFYVGQDIIACLVSLQPGAVVPEHMHEHQDEIFDVVEGEGIFVLSGQEIALKPGMTLCVPANLQHGLRAGDHPWILRETVHQRLYARQALARAWQKRWQKLRRFFSR
jgi:quercetin dioxygenase-like cupin family protein